MGTVLDGELDDGDVLSEGEEEDDDLVSGDVGVELEVGS